MASTRLQRWALTLSAYNYTIKYKTGKQQSNADALSRFLLVGSPSSIPIPLETVTVMEHLLNISLTAAKIKQQIEHDSILSKVKHYMKFGWPNFLDNCSADLNLTSTGKMG